MMCSRNRLSRVGPGFGLLFMIACQPQPARIEFADDVEPQLSFHTPGEAQHVSLVVLDSSGGALPNAKIRWSSSSPKVALVGEDGFVHPLKNGNAIIAARAGYVERTFSARVRLYDSIVTSAVRVPIEVGELKTLSARVFDADGEPIDDAQLYWRSLDSEIAAVDQDGSLVGVAPGTTKVIVEAAHLSKTIEVNVELPAEESAS